MPNKILLLDSNSLIHRAYHALPNLKTSDGLHTGAIFGFMTILLRLIKEQQPTHIAAAFDLKAPIFRHSLYEKYKANRKPMDEELREQFEPIKRLLSLMNIKIVSKEGYEGDDILGTLAEKFNDETIIVTGDRDAFQLVAPTTKIFWTKKGVSEIEVYDESKLLENGFTVMQYIDYKGLCGDPSDNIPGIAGVGEKTAKTLLQKYGSLENILSHADEISGKLGESVKNQKEIARLSRKLAEIKRDVPIECSITEIEFNPVFSAEVKKYLTELEMPTLINRMQFDKLETVPDKIEIKKQVEEITSADALVNAIKGNELSLIADEEIRFAVDSSREFKIKCVTDLFSEGINFDEALGIIRNAVKDKKLICYDYKNLLKKYDLEAKTVFDVMIASHLAKESAPIKSIETVFAGEGFETGAAEMFAVAEKLEATLQNKQLTELFYNIEQPLAIVLCKMEQRGFSVSVKKLQQLQLKYQKILNGLSAEIYSLAGTDNFNIASPKQLGDILFDKLQLKHGKKNKTGYSVSEDVLLNLKNEHPIVEKILEWRHYAKLQSTYVVGLQPLVSRGKIHTEFNQCITTTGRLSSTNPNLQNIPVRNDDAKDIKSAFTASDGCVLVSADYSQIELRLLAAMSGDEKLIEAYNRAEDIHAITASQIFGVPLNEVTPAERRDAKAVNFGIIYGISGFGLAENLSIPQYKAKQFIEKYFETYPTVKAFIERNVADAKERGYAVTMFGRRRNLQDINASNYLVRSSAERMAMNTPLQGSAADIVKLAMLQVEKRLEKMKSKMILQVHDELIIDADREEAKEVKKILTEVMENVVSIAVPLIAEAKEGADWSEI